MSFAVPVEDGTKIIMTLRATMWSDAIGEVVYEQPVSANWSAAVVNQNMIQIARSRDAARLVGQPASELTQAAIRAALTQTKGRRIEASEWLGWGRNTLTRKIHELGMDGEV